MLIRTTTCKAIAKLKTLTTYEVGPFRVTVFPTEREAVKDWVDPYYTIERNA